MLTKKNFIDENIEAINDNVKSLIQAIEPILKSHGFFNDRVSFSDSYGVILASLEEAKKTFHGSNWSFSFSIDTRTLSMPEVSVGIEVK